MSNYKPKSEEWFKKRIGKRIYRDMQGDKHCCATCQQAAEEGLIILDEQHAIYLAEIDSAYANEGIYSNYRDEL
jgi:hypothetical protein